MSLSEKFNPDNGPKRILALDGGGIRGAITIGYLEKIQHILRERYGRKDMMLSDYYDLIGGTSTGAIIAGALAIGMDARDIKHKYLKLGETIFGEKRSLIGRLSAKFETNALEAELKTIFGDRKLGDQDLKTGICIVTKRADTGSTWPLINHPGGKYFKYNEDILLRDAIRASTAAPTYFKPEFIKVDPHGQEGAFVDGGVSMHNNPALQLFLTATLKGFPFHWQTGADKLMITSIGTGYWDFQRNYNEFKSHKLWDWAGDVISMLMSDANSMNQLLLQYLSQSPTASEIDSEIGNLENDVLNGTPAMTYLRYDAHLANDRLLQLGINDVKAEELYEMSEAKNCPILTRIGENSAREEVLEEHFPAAFDIAPAVV
jgi:hypothetical protein